MTQRNPLIKLTYASGGGTVMINPSQISLINGGGSGTSIWMIGENAPVSVAETLEEVEALLTRVTR